MTRITLQALYLAVGGLKGIDTGQITVEYRVNNKPYTKVNGSQVILPEPVEVQIRGGEPVSPIEVPPTGGSCYARIRVYSYEPSSATFELAAVAIPDQAVVDIGDLEKVDPSTYVPLPDLPPSTQELLEQAEQILLDVQLYVDEEIDQSVRDYLQENPPTSGFEFQQVLPSASWVITHGFGRMPSVAVYIDGEEVWADVTATNTSVSIAFASPVVGFAILT